MPLSSGLAVAPCSGPTAGLQLPDMTGESLRPDTLGTPIGASQTLVADNAALEARGRQRPGAADEKGEDLSVREPILE